MSQNPLETTKRRGPSLRGALMLDVSRGQYRARAWPRRKGTTVTPAQAGWAKWFKEALRAYKALPGTIQAQYQAATAGTPFMPSDLWVAAQRGTFAYFTDQDGRTWFHIMTLEAVSESLDSLSQDKGDILVRGTDLWTGLAIGPPGHVLTSAGPGNGVGWSAPSGLWQILADVDSTGGVFDVQGLDLTTISFLRLVIIGATVSFQNSELRLRFYTDGTLRTSGYQHASKQYSADDLDRHNSSTAASWIVIAGASTGAFRVGNQAGNSYNAEIWLHAALNPALNKACRFEAAYARGSGELTNLQGSGLLPDTNQLDGFRVFPHAGSLNGGKLLVLGASA